MVITLLVYVSIQDRVLNKVIKENILIKSKQIKGDYLFQLIGLVKKCIQNKRHFTSLFELIDENNNKTKMLSNSKEQHRIDLIQFFPKLKETREKDEIYSVQKRQLFKVQYNDLLVLIETEIIAYISSLSRSKQLSNVTRFPLLHCDFIYYFKMNMCFSLYLIQEYLSKIKNMNYESIVNFYSLKQYILEEREKNMKHDHRIGPLNIKFKRFLNYFQTIEDIKHLLLKCCSGYQEIIAFKNIYCDSKFRKESQRQDKQLETLFKNCTKIDQLLNVIHNKLVDNFNDIQLKHPEVCFLLINFYEITQTKVPFLIQNCILEINSYEDILNFGSAFLDHEFEHPMIFSLSSVNKHEKHMKTQTDFFIFYASQKLINTLGYKENELVGKEYHILQPKMFAEPRATELKRLFFLEEDFQIQKHHFLLSKDGYYIKTKETSGIFPSLNNDTLIISNLELLIDDDDYSYQFVTDFNLNILAITSKFEQRYRINYEMINSLGLTFVNLFCLNLDKIKLYFKKEIAEIEAINIVPINNLVNVFSQNTYDNMMIAYEAEAPEIQTQKLKNDKKKRNIIQALGKIKKQIEEQEYDTDWITRICVFEKLCQTNFNYGKFDNEFEIHIQLRNIANYPYYIITLFDQDDFQTNKTNGLTSFNKLTSIKEVPQEIDYLRKVQENQNKVYLGKKPLLLNKLTTNQHYGINNNTSVNLNDTHQQLINSPKKNSLLNPSFPKQQKLISKLNKDKKAEHNGLKHVQIYKRREKYFTSFVLFLVSVITIIFVVNFFFKNSGINLVQDTAKLIFNIVKLKEAILESAILVTSGCYQLNNIEPNPYYDVDFSPDMIKAQLYSRSAEMYYFYNEYMEYLKKYYYIKEINSQLDMLSVEFPITTLNYDFTINETMTTFDKEVNYFHFHCGFIKTAETFTTCRITEYFLGGVKAPKPEDNIIASNDEIFFYYTSQNIIKAIMNLIDQLINKSSHFNYMKIKEINSQFMIFNISILSIWTLLLFSVIILIYFYTKRINAYLMIFMIKNEKTITIEKRLTNFQTILLSFDDEVLRNYEIIKSQLKDIGEIEQGMTTKRKGSKPRQSIKKREKEEQEIKEELEKSDHNSSFRIFSLKLFTNGIILFVLSFLVSVGLIVINIIVDENLLKEVLLSSETSFSYLDHISSINELLLYYRVSILNGNADFVVLPQESFDTLMFFYRLATVEVDINDSRYQFLGNSKMAFLYYRSLYEGRIISFFENSNKKSKMLPLLKEYNSKLDVQGEACKTFSSSYVLYINDFQDSFDEEFLYDACMKLESGSSNNGIRKQINDFLFAIFDEYIDFANNPSGDLAIYSQGHSFISMLKLMTFIYDVSWHIRAKIIEEEYANLFSKVKANELIFQIFSLILSTFLCSFYIIFIVEYMKLSINRFGIIIEKIKVTLND